MASDQPSGRSAAVTIVCLAVAVLAIFGSMNSYQISTQFATQYPDSYGLTRAKTRLAPIIEKIPPGERMFYISDVPATDAKYSTIFLAAQYALAPRQLVTSTA